MAVLLGTCVLGFALVGTLICTAALIWSVRQLKPVWQLEDQIESLTSQVNRLRTKKAAAASPRTKEKQPAPDEYDELAGLSPADRALFRFTANMPEEVDEVQ